MQCQCGKLTRNAGDALPGLSINLQCECQRGVGQQSEVWGNLHFVCWRIQSVDGTVTLCWGGGGQTVHQTEISSINSTSALQVKIQ